MPLVHAMKLMNTANQPTADQKNNLVFYGLEPEPLEIQMEKEPEFCRDILETRIKMIFRETLKISRDIPFVTVYRFTTANADPDEVSFMKPFHVFRTIFSDTLFWDKNLL